MQYGHYSETQHILFLYKVFIVTLFPSNIHFVLPMPLIDTLCAVKLHDPVKVKPCWTLFGHLSTGIKITMFSF